MVSSDYNFKMLSMKKKKEVCDEAVKLAFLGFCPGFFVVIVVCFMVMYDEKDTPLLPSFLRVYMDSFYFPVIFLFSWSPCRQT